MHHLSEEVKWRIIHLHKLHKNISEVARLCNCSRKAAKRWIDRHTSVGNVHRCTGTGRKPLLSKGAAHEALKLLVANEPTTSAMVCKELHSRGLTQSMVHRSTVARHARTAARELGQHLRVSRGVPRKGMTQHTIIKRLAFAKENVHRDWSKVLFTDRKKFLFRWPGSKVSMTRWHLHGGTSAIQPSVYQPNHPQCLNVYAGISIYGVTNVHVVAGTSKHKHPYTNKKGQAAKNITSSEYKAVLMSTFLPSGQHLFGEVGGVMCWVLQQDGDPTHKVANDVVAQWSKANACTVQVLPNWPPNSPDLNPIENVWAFVQARVDKMGCASFDEFKAAVIYELKHLPKHTLANLFKSMPNRMAEVIASDGGKTGY